MSSNCEVYFLLSVFVGLILNSSGAAIRNTVKNEDDFAVNYLSKYGYMASPPSSSKSGSLTSHNSFKKAVRDFQSFAKINVTGELDQETTELMKLPRCGVRDIIEEEPHTRKKRYTLQGSRWRVKSLTYKVSKYPSTNIIKTEEVDEAIKTAFQSWSDVSSLNFATSASGDKTHIDIRFETGDHNDGDPFDGAGGTLAHAYFPVYGGDVHYDNEEKWTTKTFKGTNFFQVAVHEFGHSFGLSHSDVKDALMSPFYRGYEPNFHLHSDDIEAIQALYGKRDGQSSEGTGGGEGTEGESSGQGGGGGGEAAGGGNSDLCGDSTFDAMINLGDDKTYVFKGNNYYKITDDKVEAGYPKTILDDFGIDPNVDAAFSWKSKRTYVFKGDKYWRLSDMKMDDGYPKPIDEGFKGIPNNVDAAFVWTGNDKIYFMKGSDYWKFDPGETPPVKSIYPKQISVWKGLPDNIDAAVKYINGKTYFFKGTQYYGFNDKKFAVDTVDPSYPRPTGYWWFSCEDSNTLKKPEGLKSNRVVGTKITRTNFDRNTIDTDNDRDHLNK